MELDTGCFREDPVSNLGQQQNVKDQDQGGFIGAEPLDMSSQSGAYCYGLCLGSSNPPGPQPRRAGTEKN
jgi:hypothetical protein